MIKIHMLALILAAIACVGCAPEATKAAARVEKVEDSPVVAVVSPKREALGRSVVLTGEFRPYQVVDLHAKVAGYVRKISVDAGSVVKAGQEIALLEIPEMNAELAQSAAERGRTEAELARARVEIERAEANLKLQTVSHTRLTAAAKAESGLIAQQEIDEALARRAAAEAQLSAAKAAVRVEEQKLVAARAMEQRTQTMAAYSTITAPFAGVVTKRFADVGSMIQAGTASQTQAMPVVRLADIGRLRLAATVPESVVPMMHVGLPVEVKVTALNKTLRAQVSRLNRDIAASSRTMEAEIDIANGGQELTPGMYAEDALNVERKAEGWTVPVVSVINSGGNRVVWLVNAASVVEERQITTGFETPASFEVLSGVGSEDRVIVSNRSLLRPGQKVRARAAGEN